MTYLPASLFRKDWSEEGGGGFHAYVEKDEEDGELLNTYPIKNTLTLVYRDVGCMQFTKYVNHFAPETRYDFCLNYKGTFLGTESSSEGEDEESE